MDTLEKMLSEWLDGTADTATQRRLARVLRRHPKKAELAVNLYRESRGMRHVLSGMTPAEFIETVMADIRREPDDFVGETGRRLRAETGRQHFGSRLWPAWAAAASLLLGLGVWFLLMRAKTDAPFGPPIATVSETVGTVRGRAPDGTWSVLNPGAPLYAGHRIETEARARASLSFATEPNEALLTGSSALTLFSGTRLRLDLGTLSASAAPRTAAAPFTIVTPNAKAEILGTRLRLQVAETRDSNASHTVFTRLDVDKGRVKLTRLADNAAVDVSAGQFAVAAEAIELKAYPHDTEWIDGPVLFEDDFRDGLSRWRVHLFQKPETERKDAGKPLEIAQEIPAEDSDVVSIIPPERSFEPPALRLVLPEGKKMHTVVLVPDMKNVLSETKRGYAVEYEFMYPVKDVNASHVWFRSDRPVADIPIANREKTYVPSRQWVRFRAEWQHRPDEEGNDRMEVRTYFDGQAKRHLIIYSADYHFGFGIRSKEAYLRNFTVRALVPAAERL